MLRRHLRTIHFNLSVESFLPSSFNARLIMMRCTCVDTNYGSWVTGDDSLSEALCNEGDAMLQCAPERQNPTLFTDGVKIHDSIGGSTQWRAPASFVPFGAGVCVHTNNGQSSGTVLNDFEPPIANLNLSECLAQCASQVRCGSSTFLTKVNGDTECRITVRPSSGSVTVAQLVRCPSKG